MKLYKTPKTSVQDYREWNFHHTIVQGFWSRGLMNDKQFIEQCRYIDERFQGRIFEEDRYLFDDEIPYVKFLFNFKPAEEVGRIIEHERDHFEEGRKRGYSMAYGAWLLRDNIDGFLVALAFVTPVSINKKMSRNDLSNISKAPKELTIGDKLSSF